ncbi:hypothetical protein T439DRAFT_379922 [Meredithblackwellia eburnea MCA 4105]
MHFSKVLIVPLLLTISSNPTKVNALDVGSLVGTIVGGMYNHVSLDYHCPRCTHSLACKNHALAILGLSDRPSGATSVFGDVTSGVVSIATVVTSDAAGAFTTVTSFAGSAYTVVTSDAAGALTTVTSFGGGLASTATSVAGGVATTVTSVAGQAGSTITSAAGRGTSAAGSVASQASTAVSGAGVINVGLVGIVGVAVGVGAGLVLV